MCVQVINHNWQHISRIEVWTLASYDQNWVIIVNGNKSNLKCFNYVLIKSETYLYNGNKTLWRRCQLKCNGNGFKWRSAIAITAAMSRFSGTLQLQLWPYQLHFYAILHNFKDHNVLRPQFKTLIVEVREAQSRM